MQKINAKNQCKNQCKKSMQKDQCQKSMQNKSMQLKVALFKIQSACKIGEEKLS